MCARVLFLPWFLALFLFLPKLKVTQVTNPAQLCRQRDTWLAWPCVRRTETSQHLKGVLPQQMWRWVLDLVKMLMRIWCWRGAKWAICLLVLSICVAVYIYICSCLHAVMFVVSFVSGSFLLRQGCWKKAVCLIKPRYLSGILLSVVCWSADMRVRMNGAVVTLLTWGCMNGKVFTVLTWGCVWMARSSQYWQEGAYEWRGSHSADKRVRMNGEVVALRDWFCIRPNGLSATDAVIKGSVLVLLIRVHHPACLHFSSPDLQNKEFRAPATFSRPSLRSST